VAISFVHGLRASFAKTLRIVTGVTAVLLSLNSCGRRSAPPITSINDEPAPPSEGPLQSPFAAVTEKVRPAVAVLATFDEHGGLVANEQGFFVSANGDLLAERTAMNNAASAIVKGADGRAYDTLGTYVRSSSPNFILLKTNAHNVPYLQNPRATAEVSDGALAAVVLSPSGQGRTPFLEGRIAGRKNDEAGEWLTFEPAPPRSALGAPVVDVHGSIIGIVAQKEPKDAPAVFRYTGVPTITTAKVSPIGKSNISVAVASPTEEPEEDVAPKRRATAAPLSSPPIADLQRPAEIDLGRLQAEPITPNTTPKGFFIRMNPNWHIHARDRPGAASADDTAGAMGKLVYTPLPHYSSKQGDVKAGGSYRLTFNAEGTVTDVEIMRSAGSTALDQAAMGTLRNWRAEPGRQWSVVVPIRFKH
jgi:TonB family protein